MSWAETASLLENFALFHYQKGLESCGVLDVEPHFRRDFPSGDIMAVSASLRGKSLDHVGLFYYYYACASFVGPKELDFPLRGERSIFRRYIADFSESVVDESSKFYWLIRQCDFPQLVKEGRRMPTNESKLNALLEKLMEYA